MCFNRILTYSGRSLSVLLLLSFSIWFWMHLVFMLQTVTFWLVRLWISSTLMACTWASRGRTCKVQGCKKLSVIWCKKCRVYLCLKKGCQKFFEALHTPQLVISSEIQNCKSSPSDFQIYWISNKWCDTCICTIKNILWATNHRMYFFVTLKLNIFLIIFSHFLLDKHGQLQSVY